MKLRSGAFVLLSLSAAGSAQNVTTFASGLQHPSKVTLLPGSGLLVTETGDEPNSGKLSFVDFSGVRRILIEGLPSGLSAPGNEADGPNGAVTRDGIVYIAIGEGDGFRAGPRPGTLVANPAGPSSPLFSSILRVRFSRDAGSIAGGFRLTRPQQDALADGDEITLFNFSGEQATLDILAQFRPSIPDGRTIYRNSHPFSLTLHPSYPNQLFVADAGMNTLVRVDLPGGRSRALVRFTDIPNFSPGPPSVEPVPDSVRPFGDQLLVTQLSGAPFIAGISRIMSIDPAAGTSSVFIAGLSSAIDVLPREMPDGKTRFYVLQYSTNQAARPPEAGSLLQYDTPQGVSIVSGLAAPTGMALDEAANAMYITDRAGGRIVRVSLP